MSDEFENVIPVETCACEVCGASTFMTGTKRCDRCWEVEHRLADYLKRGGAKALQFVIEVVDGLPD